MHLRLTIARRFFGVLMVLWPLMLALALVGVIGLGSLKSAFDHQFVQDIRARQTSATLGTGLARANEIALELPLANRARRRQLNATLDQSVLPAVDAALRALGSLRSDGDAGSASQLARIERGWSAFLALRETNALAPQAEAAPNVGAAEHDARVIDSIFDPLRTVTENEAALEQTRAGQANARADQIYHTSRLTIWAIAALAFALGIGAVLLLTRNVVPRVRRYSQFAAAVANGDLSGRLGSKGSDELAALGHALDEMVEHRAVEASQREARDEFVETLQVTDTEAMAHDLLRRQVQRSIPQSTVVVLNRNKADNRLDASTSLADATWLEEPLGDANFRSCLAVRFARQHCESPERQPLSHCEVCGRDGRQTTCQPLLVGGEVIGSVLVEHQNPLAEQDLTALQESVSQAAPVLANLRNLASAEHRALTDSLTGLSNKRAVQDTTKRMAAYASRTASPLSAIALDLDHFKQINDHYGHDAGDATLAAVGAVLTQTVRASDFVGRNGGEEFIVLLPDTDTSSTMIVADRIRQAIAAISVPHVDRDVTVSLGIATLPDHAGNGESLIRSADQALYMAKANGRNRVEIAEQHHSHAAYSEA